MEKKVLFRDLPWYIRVGVVGGWLVVLLLVWSLIMGFITATARIQALQALSSG